MKTTQYEKKAICEGGNEVYGEIEDENLKNHCMMYRLKHGIISEKILEIPQNTTSASVLVIVVGGDDFRVIVKVYLYETVFRYSFKIHSVLNIIKLLEKINII